MRQRRRARGDGHTNPAGYRIICVGGVHIMEHRHVWEKHHDKKIPDGLEVHHKDGNRSNNRIENLQLISHRSHTRLHKGWKWMSNEWWKCCCDCKKLKPVTEYRGRKDDGISHLCWVCERKRQRDYHKANLERRRAANRARARRKRCDPHYREMMRQYGILYREAHRDKLRAKARVKYQLRVGRLRESLHLRGDLPGQVRKEMR